MIAPQYELTAAEAEAKGFLYDAVMIVPLELEDDANRLAWGAGGERRGYLYAPTFSYTRRPATLRGGQIWARQAFVDLLTGQAPLPPLPWEDYGLTADRVQAVRAAIQSHVSPIGCAVAHWRTALAEL